MYKKPKTKFWNGNNINDLQKGTPVLLRGVPTGSKGGESTKVVVYNAVVQGWDGEKLHLIKDGQRTEYSVPLCNVQADPESEYVIKYDGSCYEYNKLLSDWKRKVQCPKCQNTFGSEWACDMPFTILGTCPLLEHARLFCNSRSRRAFVINYDRFRI